MDVEKEPKCVKFEKRVAKDKVELQKIQVRIFRAKLQSLQILLSQRDVRVMRKRVCVNEIYASKKIREKLRQALSDELSSRKRKARDLLFTVLGFRYLHSSYTAHSDK